MLSESQKREIFIALPKQFVVKGVTLNPAFRYANQWTTKEFPAVILNYPDEGHAEVEDIEGGELLSSRLSINVYATPQRVNGVFLPAEVQVQEIARQLRDWFKQKRTEPIAQDLYVLKISEIRNFSLIPELRDVEKAARSQFDVMLSYMVVV